MGRSNCRTGGLRIRVGHRYATATPTDSRDEDGLESHKGMTFNSLLIEVGNQNLRITVMRRWKPADRHQPANVYLEPSKPGRLILAIGGASVRRVGCFQF